MLTVQQRDIYNFIKKYREAEGYFPSLREIGKAFGITSPNGVACHIKALARKGYIVKVEGKARAYVLHEVAISPEG